MLHSDRGDRRIWIVATVGIVAIATAVRFGINFSSTYPRGSGDGRGPLAAGSLDGVRVREELARLRVDGRTHAAAPRRSQGSRGEPARPRTTSNSNRRAELITTETDPTLCASAPRIGVRMPADESASMAALNIRPNRTRF